jgi:hypothetical protein
MRGIMMQESRSFGFWVMEGLPGSTDPAVAHRVLSVEEKPGNL